MAFWACWHSWYYLSSESIAAESGGTFWAAALTAGLGAATVVRARVFSAKVGTQDIAIGPGFVIDQLLNVVDREIDRKQAEDRVRIVRDKMSDVPFDLVEKHVQNMITSGRQNMSPEDSKEFGTRIGSIAGDGELSEAEKSRALGFLVLDMMGPKFLNVLIDDDFIQQLRNESEQQEQILDEQQDRVETNAMLIATHLTGVTLQTFVDKLTLHQLSDQFANDISQQQQKVAQDPTLDQLSTMALGFSVIAAIGPDEFSRIMGS